MNVDDDRLGNRDVDAAALFAAARSFRPSPRGRRRVMRALGLPIGLSLFGSGLAQAAYLLTSSIKGWGMVAGVVATVGAAGGVTYVVTAPSTPTRAVSKQVPGPSSRSAVMAPIPAWPEVAEVAEVADVPEVPEVPTASTKDTAPAIAVPSLPGVDRSLPRTVPKPVQKVSRLSMRAEPRALPSHRLAVVDDGGPSAAALSKSLPEETPVERPVERPVEVVRSTIPSVAPSPTDIAGPGTGAAPSSLAPPAFRASAESATPRPRPAADAGRPASSPVTTPVSLPVSSSPPASSSLKAELALVAEAQARLRADDARGAFAALDLHVRLYPSGALAEEVQLLRMRAFIAKSDTRAARQTGETFLQRHPASPLRARFRSLMNALDAPAIR